MLKKTGMLVFLCMALMLSACNNSSTSDTSQNDGSVTSGEKKDPAQPTYARYNFKSGIITFKATVLVMDQEIITYFDDWGRKQRTELNISFMGQKSKNITINDSSFVYSWDPDKKAGVKSPLDLSKPENMNYNELTDEVKKKYQIKEDGTGKVLDRECKVYSMVFSEAGISGKYYVWNGIALKTEASAQGLGINIEATKIEENVSIPAEKFSLPTDVDFVEMSAKDAAAMMKK
jgi:hypothetical protein